VKNQEPKPEKINKLKIRKVTLRNLDEQALNAVAGGLSHLPCPTITCTCNKTICIACA